MTLTDRFARSLCLAVDARGYGASDDEVQSEWQQALLDCLDTAAERAGLDRPQWSRQAKGDEELALLPDDGSEPRVVDDFVHELDRTLAHFNRSRPAEGRLRLRMAVHHGVAFTGANGTPGQAVVLVSRLLSSRPAHQALEAAPQANLAVMLSTRVFEDVVVQPHTSLRPEDFRRVEVAEKELRTEAWLRVPGFDVHRLELGTVPAAAPAMAPEPDQRAEVINNFAGRVDAGHANFGVSRGGDA